MHNVCGLLPMVHVWQAPRPALVASWCCPKAWLAPSRNRPLVVSCWMAEGFMLV